MPGLMDNHVFFSGYLRMQAGIDLSDCHTKAEALAKIKDLIKPNVNKMTEEVKEPQPWEAFEMQHIDPFDDFENYQSHLKAEGKPLPQALRFMGEKSAGGGV